MSSSSSSSSKTFILNDQMIEQAVLASGNRKRKYNELKLDEENKLEIMPIGAGNEVGRSCVILKFKGKTLMFDCGVHPGLSGMNALPYFDEIETSEVDLLLVTHFHLDHCAAVPYLLENVTHVITTTQFDSLSTHSPFPPTTHLLPIPS
eukprot:TRINITY_DN568_c1_g1_i2.p1 TRINITY_DN568_c1_g1~~TRINITY_DN568_c1_g1_i2.p1  ORF type:complete len:158 (-),score=44.22 TRINITY_DN568_c1_g1_i2:21-467(-)